jgi:hypothetical protein
VLHEGGCGSRSAPVGWDVQRGIGGEDLLVQSLQREAGGAAEFFGQQEPGALVVAEGIGWATTAVQGEDELAGQSFVQWVCLDPGG